MRYTYGLLKTNLSSPSHSAGIRTSERRVAFAATVPLPPSVSERTDMAAIFPDPRVEDVIVGFPLRLITELSPCVAHSRQCAQHSCVVCSV